MSTSARIRRGLPALVLAAVLLAAPGVATAETMGSDVTLTVEVYRNPGGREVAFNRDLDKVGVLALRVTVTNGSERELIVRRTDMTLRLLGSGRQVGSISAKQAALRADRGPNVAGVVVGAIFGGYTGAAMVSSANERAQRNQISSYDTKEFKDIALAPEESAQGYVFFHLASGIANAQDGALLVRLIDNDSGALAVAAVPLKDVGGAAVETPEPESRLIRENGRDTASQGTSAAPAEPQVEVIGTASTVSVPAPDPVADQPAAAPAPENVTPMTGTALTAPPPSPVEDTAEAEEADTTPLAGPSTRP